MYWEYLLIFLVKQIHPGVHVWMNFYLGKQPLIYWRHIR